MTLAAYRFAIALVPQVSSCCSITPSFISTLPDNKMSLKRSSGSSDKSSKKKTKQQQSSLTGFFKSANAKADDDDDAVASFKYKIFCDLDGVLVDFDSGVKSLFNGRSPDELPAGTMVRFDCH